MHIDGFSQLYKATIYKNNKLTFYGKQFDKLSFLVGKKFKLRVFHFLMSRFTL